METRQLGKTGLQVSVIGFGSAPVGFLDTDVDDVSKLLHTLLDAGVNLIDTAAAYPGSEEVIGEVASERRDDFVLVSKCGAPGSDSADPSWTPEALTASIDRSLSRLRTDVLDVILLHSCSLETLRGGDAIGALVTARDAGKVKFVGYSGDNEAAAFAADHREISVIETSVNICDQANIDSVLPKTQHNQIGVIAKRPIANACWKDLGQQRGMYQDYARTYTERLASMNLSPQDLGLGHSGISHQLEDAWPQIALRFTLSQPGVHTAIIGTTNLEHAQHNLAAASEGLLPRETIERIRLAFQRAEAASGERWLGQT